MKLRAISLSALAFAAATLALSQSASASLIYDASIHAPAQGFGNAPRDLSLQATGQATFESGAVDYTGSGIDFRHADRRFAGSRRQWRDESIRNQHDAEPAGRQPEVRRSDDR